MTPTSKQLPATFFRPLLHKVKASMKTGNDADEVYRPTWFAFETIAKFDLAFIGLQVQRKQGTADSYALMLDNNYRQHKITLTIQSSSLVFSPKAGFGRNQSPVRRPVWLWLPLLSPAFRRSHFRL